MSQILTYGDWANRDIQENPIFRQLRFPKYNVPLDMLIKEQLPKLYQEQMQQQQQAPGQDMPMLLPPMPGAGEGSGMPSNMPGSGTGNGRPPLDFTQPVQELMQIPGLQKLTNEDPEMAEQVTRDIMDFMRKAEEEVADVEKNPLKNEMEILEAFKAVKAKDFKDNWQGTGPFLEDTYRQDQIDTRFYAGQFEKSLQPTEDKPKTKKGQKPPKKIKFSSVKKNLVKKWEKLLDKKQEAHEQAVVFKYKEYLKIEFEGKLQKMKGLMDMLAPFELKPGQLFGMAKGAWKRGNLDILKQYADLLKNDKSLKELADLMGRVSQAEKEQERETYMKTVIIPEFKPVHAGKSEIKGIRESDDVANMLSSEMLLLCDPELEVLFYSKFIEKKLNTYEYHGTYLTARIEEHPDVRIKEVEGKRGPYILCVDTSGSMMGKPEVVCKVLAFALTKRALAEKRKCFLITFSDSIQTLELTDIGNSIQGLLDFLSCGFNGGTDPEPALKEAVRKIEQDDSFKKADVLMLSDFEMSGLSRELTAKMKVAKENKTKFNSLVIQNGFGGMLGAYATGNKKVIEVFDNNWSFDPGNKQEVIKF